MKRVFVIVAIVFGISICGYTQKCYTPVKSNPLTEKWRWRSFPELDGKNVWIMTEDGHGNYWFGCDKSIIEYNGYEFAEHQVPSEADVGLCRYIAANDLGVFVGSFFGVSLFDKGKWTNIIKVSDDIKQKTDIGFLSVSQIVSVENDLVAIALNYGILIVTSQEKNFYTSPLFIKKYASFFPDIQFFALFDDFGDNSIPNFSGLINVDGEYLILANNECVNWIISVEISSGIDGLLKKKEVTKSDVPFSIYRENYLYFSQNDELWISNSSENVPLYKIDSNNNFTEFLVGEASGNQHVTTEVIPLDNGGILVGGHGCLYYINNDVKRFAKNEIPISTSTRISLYKDNKGNVWVINSRDKVSLVDLSNKRWNTYPDLLFQFEDKNGFKWFISRNNKIVFENNGHFFSYDKSDGLMSNPLTIIETTKGDIWCAGSDYGSAASAYLKNDRWETQLHNLGWGISVNGLYEDGKGNIWFGSSAISKYEGKGIAKLNYDHLSDLRWEYYYQPKCPVIEFVELNDTVYASTNTGIYTVKKDLLDSKTKIPRLSYGVEIDAFARFNDSLIAVGTRGKGLKLVDLHGETKHFSLNNVLASNVIIDVCPSPYGGLWVATENDIAYYTGDNWISHCFIPELNLQHGAGNIAVAPDRSFWIVHSNKNWLNQSKNGKGVKNISGEFFSLNYISDTLPPKTFINTRQDTIPHKGNIHISWFGVDKWGMTLSNELLYSFRLNEGDWTDFSELNSYTFLSLKSGTHSFYVKAMDKDFNVDPNPAVFQFYVMYPFWRQPWFIAMISFFIITIVILLLRIIFHNRKLAVLNADLKQAYVSLDEQKESIIKKNEEIHHAKINFFTNISHEFKTPLTLICGPIDELIQNQEMDKTSQLNAFKLIKNNASRLLSLVNELLEFRKIETGNSKLILSANNFNDFISSVAKNYYFLAEHKQVKFETKIGNFSGDLELDYEKLEKIISNLLINAIKYTDSGEYVLLKVDRSLSYSYPKFKDAISVASDNMAFKECLSITVYDTGMGISKDSLKHIFERFFQVGDNEKNIHLGSGIGLALVKSLVLAHKGEILVSSEPMVGTEFIVRIPIEKSFYQQFGNVSWSNIKTENKAVLSVNNTVKLDDTDNKSLIQNGLSLSSASETILVVEDNKEIQAYIANALSMKYRVVLANDGRKALRVLNKQRVDLLLSDIMMPNMGGLELCSKIKSDPNLCHIPIIILTAKDTIADKVEAVKTGADLYVEKPFNMEFLLSSIQNIFNYRRILQQKFCSDIYAENSMLAKNITDKKFLDDVISIVDKRMHETDFKLDELCKEVGMSRTVFYHKLKSLTNQSPIDFLRTLRLKKAAQLLSKGDDSIDDILNNIGIKSRSNFIKIFKAHFGILPSDFKRQK